MLPIPTKSIWGRDKAADLGVQRILFIRFSCTMSSRFFVSTELQKEFTTDDYRSGTIFSSPSLPREGAPIDIGAEGLELHGNAPTTSRLALRDGLLLSRRRDAHNMLVLRSFLILVEKLLGIKG